MNTELSIKEIEKSIVEYFGGVRKNICVPNVSWGLLNHEADLIIINRGHYATEVEIKRSWSDFVADFAKKEQHNDERIYRFYYCLPDAICEKAKEFLMEKYKYQDSYNRPEILSYGEDGGVKCLHFGNPLSPSKTRRKLFIEEVLQVARLGCMRLYK